MDGPLRDPAVDAPLPDGDVGGGRAFSLRPKRGRWDAALARSTAALDAALRASLSTDPGTGPLTRWQRARAAGAALAGLGGVGGLAALAGVRPDLGPYEGAALSAAVGAAALPVALCIRRAIVGTERRPAAEGMAPLDGPSAGLEARRGGFRRLMNGLGGPDRGARRRARRQSRAVSRALADIALRERRLAASIAAGDGAARDPSRPSPPSAPPPTPAPPPAAPAEAPGASPAPWAMPREIADALADLEARERLQAERIAAARRPHHRAHAQAGHAAPHPAAPRPAPSPPASAAIQKTRRHARITPRNTRTLIATEDGRKLNATVLDVSQSGVAIEGNLPGLWIGSMVTVGSRRAKAVRVLPRGMAFEFSMPVPAEALTADLVL